MCWRHYVVVAVVVVAVVGVTLCVFDVIVFVYVAVHCVVVDVFVYACDVDIADCRCCVVKVAVYNDVVVIHVVVGYLDVAVTVVVGVV